MPDGLKIENRDNVILFDSSLITGVDYDEELFRNQDPALLADSDEHQDSKQDSNFEDQDLHLDEENSSVNELNENDFIYNNNTEEIQIQDTEDTDNMEE